MKIDLDKIEAEAKAMIHWKEKAGEDPHESPYPDMIALISRLRSAEEALILCRDIFKYHIDTDVYGPSDEDGYSRARDHFEKYESLEGENNSKE